MPGAPSCHARHLGRSRVSRRLALDLSALEIRSFKSVRRTESPSQTGYATQGLPVHATLQERAVLRASDLGVGIAYCRREAPDFFVSPHERHGLVDLAGLELLLAPPALEDDCPVLRDRRADDYCRRQKRALMPVAEKSHDSGVANSQAPRSSSAACLRRPSASPDRATTAAAGRAAERRRCHRRGHRGHGPGLTRCGARLSAVASAHEHVLLSGRPQLQLQTRPEGAAAQGRAPWRQCHQSTREGSAQLDLSE
jgi:hypothetical protein